MTRFDLTAEGKDHRRQVRRVRRSTLAFTVVLVVATVSLSLRWELLGSWTPPDREGLAGLAIVAAALGSVSWILGPSAVAVEVDSEGVRFQYPGDRVRSLAWKDPHFRLVIDHTTGSVDTISVGRPMQVAAGRRAFQDFLTPAAYREIREGADRNGLVVSDRRSPRRGWTRSTIARSRASATPAPAGDPEPYPAA
ncbi:MAG: hypothetical protein WBF81_01825 [Thermoplasmata archaeon]